MTTIKNCNSCGWCTDKNFEDQTGRCIEPHAPRNARGEITSRTHLSYSACRKYKPVEEPAAITNIVHEPPVKKPRGRKPTKTLDMTL